MEPANEEPSPPTESAAPVDRPEESLPPSTASYEDAMSTPEKLDTRDGRAHLTDDQLRGPMRGVVSGCGMPRNAKVTIRTAVQNGRAIGVSVDVAFEQPRTPAAAPAKRRPSRAAARRAAAAAQRRAKARAKKKEQIAACIDRAVRAVVWPPSDRRDSFTTQF
jgi:hypothetical protein